MTEIAVNGPNPYTVHIGYRLTENLALDVKGRGVSQVAIIHQPTLSAAAREISTAIGTYGIGVHLFSIPDAEAGKTLEVAGSLWDQFGERGIDRHDLVIGLGGGAATDVAGFVAAAWMRGIPVIQVPTTLLGMVDAAVGGKTGINTAAGKNLVGAFHEPAAVYVDLERLYTLPEETIIAGSAEIIKAGFISDTGILSLYEDNPQGCIEPGPLLAELVARAIRVKANVVSQDLRESNLREILNYGHTFGHAIEQNENFTWPHGHAVSVGMVFVAELAQELGLIDAELVTRHRRILQSVGLPTTYAGAEFDDLYVTMGRDKKNQAGRIRFVALDGEVGRVTRIEGPAKEDLERAFKKIG